MELPPRGINARFGFIQSEIHSEYFYFLYNIISSFSLCGPAGPRTYSYLDERTNKIYISLSFWTLALPILTVFWNAFYEGSKKIIPFNLIYLLSPLALAHWIMQDGAKGTDGGLYLCTDSFDPAEVVKLAAYLTTRYNLPVLHQKLLVNWEN